MSHDVDLIPPRVNYAYHTDVSVIFLYCMQKLKVRLAVEIAYNR